MPSFAELLVSCSHADRCAGCAFIRRPYSEQLVEKRAALKQAIRSYPELESVNVAEMVGTEAVTDYRLRAKLAVEGRAIGLFERGTHRVLDIPECRVLSPTLRETIAKVRAALPADVPLLAVDARAVDEGVLLTLVVALQSDEKRLHALVERLRADNPALLGISVSRRATRSPQLLGSAPLTVWGAETAPHRLATDAPFHAAAPGSFVQAHAQQATRLHEAVEQALTAGLGGLRDQPILELFAGSGALALRLARAGARVTAVDSFEPGVRRLEAAARAQGLSVHGVGATAEAALESATAARAVLVNPPRRGLSPEIRRAVARLAPERVVYISCSPATLARDLAHFARLGYGAERVTPFDMIPLSDAVEALTVLRAEPVPPLRVIYADEVLIAVDKPPFLSTTPQGEQSFSLLEHVRKLPGAERAVPVHRLDIGTSGVCLFARVPEAVAPIAEALAHGQKYYLTLARGIVRERGNIRHPLRDGKKVRAALTRYVRERVVGTHSLASARPEQGRQHQIRRHFASIGHPVLGDDRYGDAASNRYFQEQHGLDRPFLHLERIELVLQGRELTLRAPLAADLGAVVASLEQPAPSKRDEAATSRE